MLCRVSDYIPEIIDFISKLVSSGFAYVGADASVYFDLSKYEQSFQYYQFHPCPDPPLNGFLKEKEKEKGKEKEKSGDKVSERDFALWKAAKPQDLKVGAVWDSPFGPGRPGWHIECSAMASTVLAPNHLDFHFGGIDLAYPHHENELAQCQALHYPTTLTQPWCSFFVHCAHLHVKGGEKMSKSLNNFVSIKDAMKIYPSDLIRLFCFSSHYRKAIEFSEERIEECRNLLLRLTDFMANVRSVLQSNLLSRKWTSNDSQFFTEASSLPFAVVAALENDLGTPLAIERLFNCISSYYLYMSRIPSGKLPNRQVIELLQANVSFVCLELFGLTSLGHPFDEKRTFVSYHEFVDLAVRTRSSIRSILLNRDGTITADALKDNILKELDAMRNQAEKVGIKIKDVSSKESTWYEFNA